MNKPEEGQVAICCTIKTGILETDKRAEIWEMERKIGKLRNHAREVKKEI